MFIKQLPRVSLVGGCVFVEPNIEDALRILGEKILFEPVHGPLNGLLGVLFDYVRRFITNNNEWRLDHNRKLCRWQAFAEFTCMFGEVVRGRICSDRRRRCVASGDLRGDGSAISLTG